MNPVGFSSPRFGRIHYSDVQPNKAVIRHLDTGDVYFVPHRDIPELDKWGGAVLGGHRETKETVREDGQPSHPCNCATPVPDIFVGNDPETGGAILTEVYPGEMRMIFQFDKDGYTNEYSLVEF